MNKRKKITLILIITMMIVSSLSFIGCSKTNFIASFSKNVNEYNISLIIDEVNHTVDAKQSVSYINTTETSLDNVCFHLYPNSFKQGVANKPVSVLYEARAYPNGESFGEINITSVKINNADVKVEYEGVDKTILKVNLPSEIYPNDRVNIDFEYSLTLPNINHRFGYGNNTINLGNFYPIACVFENGEFSKEEYHYNGDPFYSDMANYNVQIDFFENYILASSGNVVFSETNNHTKTVTIEAKAVRDFAMVLSDKFMLKTANVGDTTINYYYYNDQKPEESLNTAIDSLNTFNDMIGSYPYQNLSVVESNFVHGGMEFPNLVLISDSLEKYEDYQNTIIHEIAHQWWYGMVGNNEYDYGWLDEGLTEYSTALFYEKNPSYNLTYTEIMSNANSSYCMFVEVYTDIFGEVDTTMTRTLSQYKTEPEYIYISYVKGVLLFDSLRQVLGDRAFFKGLKKYFETSKGMNVTPSDMIASFEKSSLRNLESFFDSWIDGKVVVVPKEDTHSSLQIGQK